MTRHLVIVARCRDPGMVRERLGQAARFYARLGPVRLSERHLPRIATMVAVVDFADRAHDLSEPVVFGAELPSGLRSAAELLSATDRELRDLDGPLAAVAATPDVVRIVTACGPPTMLYAARSDVTRVWSSHALAAGYVAHGHVRVDAGVLAEFMAAQFVGDTRTLLRDVTAVDSATRITITSEDTRTDSYWAARDRWQLVDSGDAAAHVEQSLLVSLPRRLAAYRRPFCGLTGGLDSRVVTVALRELDIDFETFTFGESAWPDVVEGSACAARLGVTHHPCDFRWSDGAGALRTARADVLWHEGAIPLSIGGIAWPQGMSAWITGSGGETGRAFFYNNVAPSRESVPADELADVLFHALVWRIRGANQVAVASVRAAVERWIAEARALGVEGWRILDVVYAEQRLRRWLRGMMTYRVGPTVPAFTAPEIQRGLISLPHSERASSGFHRWFLARHAPSLAPRSASRAGVVRTLIKSRYGSRPVAVAKRAHARISQSVRQTAPSPARSLLESRWAQHREFHAWIADEILTSPLLSDSLGDQWSADLRRRFLAGSGDAEETAFWAAGPIALSAEIEHLNLATHVHAAPH